METEPLLPRLDRTDSQERAYASELRQIAECDLNAKLVSSLFVDSLPVILSYILQNSIQTIAVLIAGRLGPAVLSATAFAYMLAFVTGWCIALGGTTALDTFGSQAFTGGARPTDVGLYFQRCVLLLWLLLLPVYVLWLNIERVLLALGQEPDLSKDVASILRVLLIGAPGYVAFESMKKYLQCQGIMHLSTLALIIVSPLNIGLNIVLVHHSPLGMLGSPLALSITYWAALLVLVALTATSARHRRNKTWGGWRIRQALLDARGAWSFLKLALPGILMVGTEWAAFEIVALAAGRLGALPLAAQSVIMTTDQILNTLPFGIGVAASARVGNLIGARSALGAAHAGHAAALLSVLVGSVVMVSLLAAKDVFGYVFSDDEDVVKLVGKVMPLVASFQVADGLAGSCGGVLRGLGRQHIGAYFNIGAYYVLALPMGIALAFSERTHMGLQGLWIGQVVALFIVGLGMYGVVWKATSWEEEVKRGVERNRENDQHGQHERNEPNGQSVENEPQSD